MDMQKKARGKLNWFERVLLKIPGFKGYYEREFRRDADRLQREFIVRQLNEAERHLSRTIQTVSRQKDLALLTEFDLLSKRLQKTVGEILYADRGYSGFFDLVKIGESELDAVYRLDGEMIDAAERFCAATGKVADAPQAAPRFDAFKDALAHIEALLAKRIDLLKGYRE